MGTIQAHYFGDVYDCQTQAQNYEWGAKERARLYLGRLRLDAYINRRVVIKDGDVIDGRFFLDISSTSMIKSLPFGRINFALRTGSFKESIFLSFKRPDSEFLKPLFLDSIPEGPAKALTHQLARCPAERLQSWEDVPKLIYSLGVPKDQVERLESGWRRFSELDEQNILMTQKWPSPKEFNFKAHLLRLLEVTKKHLLAALRTPEGAHVAKDILALQTDSQTDVVVYLRSVRKAHSAPEVHRDLATIESWYGGAHNRIAAAQHNCDVTEFSDFPGSAAISEGQKAFDELSSLSEPQTNPICFGYPSDFVEVLGKMDAAEFDEVIKEQRGNLDLWYDDADPKALRRALDVLVERLEKKYGFDENVISEPFATALRVIVPAGSGAAIAAILSRRKVVTLAAGAAMAFATEGAKGLMKESVTDAMNVKKGTARHVIEKATKVRRESQ